MRATLNGTMGMLAVVVLGLAASSAGGPVATTADSATTPGNETALRAYTQGRLHEVEGDPREALADYLRALGIEPRSAVVARHIAELVSHTGDMRSAIEFADRALAADSTEVRARWVKGDALVALGRTADALPLLEACVDQDSSRLEYALSLGRAAETLDRLDLVERAYALAVKLDEEDPENWFQLAAAQARLGAFEAANESLTEAEDLGPLRPGQLFLQGWVDEGLGKNAEAIDMYRRHLEAHPDDQVTRRRLVNLLSRARRWEEAYTESRRVSHDDPGDWDALQVEMDLALKARRGSDARPVIERMRQLAENDPDRAGRLAGVLIRNGDKSGGIRAADGWAAHHPRDPRGPLLAARVRALAGEREAALPFARRAVDAAPDSILPRLVLARLDADLKRWDEADGTLAEAVRRHPADPDIALELASLREGRGDVTGAESAARDALRLAPANPRALNFLGYLLADHDRDLDEAERLIREAVQADPDNGAYVDSLGWLYFRRGRFPEAREQLERAVELTGGDAVVREHLGDCYEALKLLAQAREQYRQALVRDASNTRLRGKLTRLSR